MVFTQTARITLSFVALFAMVWVHVSKPARGFECDCGDAPVFTVQDHCHGPHSAACHEDEDHSIPHQHEEEDDDTHHHTVLIESLLALKADSSLFASIAATVPAVCCVITSHPVVHAEPPAPRHLAAHLDSRRWPQVLAHSIALRV